MNSIIEVCVNETGVEVCTSNNMKIADFSKKRKLFNLCYKSEATFLKRNRVTNAEIYCSVASQ